MKPLFDLHTHTVFSGHAYSTIKENIDEAKAVGLLAYGCSDHATMMPGTGTEGFFMNMKVVPRHVDGLLILRGSEVNICSTEGDIDLSPKAQEKMDYCIASIHLPCVGEWSKKENTNAVLRSMEHSCVRIIGHPDDARFPLDLEEVAREAAAHEVALELNNSSLSPLSVRIGARENILEYLKYAEKFGTKIVLGTDSHICYQIGKFEDALALLEEARFPEELVLNREMDGLNYILRRDWREM